MRECIARAHKVEPYERSGAAAQAAGPRYTPDPLSLPRASAVPAQREMCGKHDQAFACLALNMLDTGLLSDADAGSPTRLVQDGIARWIASIVGETAQLNEMTGMLGLSVGSAYGWHSGMDEPSDEDAYLALAIEAPEQVIVIGRVMEQLESIQPGLGQTVFTTLEDASFKTVSAFTPRVGEYHGSNLYWLGVTTEDEWRDEMEACYGPNWESEEDLEWFSPNQYRNSFGCEWLFGKRRALPDRKLKRLARRHPLEWVRRLCSLVLHMQALIVRRAMLPGTELVEAEHVFYSVILRWRDNDALIRVFDSHVERANEGADGYTDVVSILEVPYDKEAFVTWEAGTREGFRLYQLFNAALAVIVEQDQESQNDPSDSQRR